MMLLCLLCNWLPLKDIFILSKLEGYHYFEILDVKKFIELKSTPIFKYTLIILVANEKKEEWFLKCDFHCCEFSNDYKNGFAICIILWCEQNFLLMWFSQIWRVIIKNSWSGIVYSHFSLKIWYKKVKFVIFMGANSCLSLKNLKRFLGKFYSSSIFNIYNI